MEKMIARQEISARDSQPLGSVRASGLRKQYPRKGLPPINVLEDCTFDIEPGKLTVLMGTSGCGKSTLAYILAGYLQPDTGTLTMDGQPVRGPGPDRIMVFQETALWPWMTIMENVLFGPRVMSSMSMHLAEEKALQLLMKFGLIDFRDKYPGQLSGGMKRREIGRAHV